MNLFRLRSDLISGPEENASMSAERERLYQEILVLRCKRREKEALGELVATWERRLFYYVSRLVEDEEDAWDVLQETWFKVVLGIRTLRDSAALPMWLYRIARNTAMSHLRKRYQHKNLEEATEQALVEESEADSFVCDDAELVHRALDQLNLPHREVLTLHFLRDLSIEETASVLDVPPGTVKSRLHYAKQALRELLEKEGALR